MNTKFNIGIIIIFMILMMIVSCSEESSTGPIGPISHWTCFESVYFIDENNGWVVGWKGDLIATIDGGTSWDIQESGTNYKLNSVFFMNTKTGLIAGGEGLYSEGGVLLKTNDGGKSWFSKIAYNLPGLETIHFINSETGWAAGSDQLYRTNDGGENWIALDFSCDMGLFGGDICFINADTGWAGGHLCCVRTFDGGNQWTDMEFANLPEFFTITAIDFVFEKTGWLVEKYGTLFKTTNSGKSWTAQNIGLVETLYYAVDFIDVNTGWVVGDFGTIVKTTDGGESWILQKHEPDDGSGLNLNDVYFIDENTGWIVGDENTILKTTDGGENWTILSSW